VLFFFNYGLVFFERCIRIFAYRVKKPVTPQILSEIYLDQYIHFIVLALAYFFIGPSVKLLNPER
jgi:hypothetical protein